MRSGEADKGRKERGQGRLGQDQRALETSDRAGKVRTRTDGNRSGADVVLQRDASNT